MYCNVMKHLLNLVLYATLSTYDMFMSNCCAVKLHSILSSFIMCAQQEQSWEHQSHCHCH